MPDRLTVDQALSVLPDGEYIHTFIGGGALLFGADWPRAEAEEAIRKEGGAGLAGPTARRMGHGIFITRDRGSVFVETVEERLALVDPAAPEVAP